MKTEKLKIKLSDEISRIKELIEPKNKRIKEIEIANKLINALSQADELWAEKVKIIGFQTTIFTGEYKDVFEAKTKLNSLLRKHPNLLDFSWQIRDKIKNT